MDKQSKPLIRNMGIMAHIDAGKTTTTERILFYSGKLHRVGQVDEGTTAMDWMAQEQERGITIVAAATTFYWKDCQVNLIDTPGHVDFTVEVERSLRVLDGAVTILCSVGRVEPQTETVWRQANKHQVPRIIYINKLDRLGADFDQTVQEFSAKLSSECAPVQIPVGQESEFRAIIDVIDMKQYDYNTDNEEEVVPNKIEDDFLSNAKEARKNLCEVLAERDEEFLTEYLEEESISSSSIKSAIRRLTMSNDFYPIFCGSSLKNKGVLHLMDGIVEYLPEPDYKKQIVGARPNGDQVSLMRSSSESLSALAFKVVFDSFVDKIVYTRIYSGKIKKGQRILNVTTNKKERVGRILRLHANSLEDLDVAEAGEIVGLVGLKFTRTGDTLCFENDSVLLEVIEFPEPVISMAIEAKSQGDSKKLELVLNRFMEEDPTFKVGLDKETGQKIISGMGELHLEIIQDRIKREERLEVRIGKPQVAYRETILNESKHEYVLEKEINGEVVFAQVELELSPLKRGQGVEVFFQDNVKVLTDVYKDLVRDSIRMSASYGSKGIYPLTDYSVRVNSVSLKDESNSEVAIQMATSQCFEMALRKNKAVTLEPIMLLQVNVIAENQGDVIGDLNSRGGKIVDLSSEDELVILQAEVPLAKIFGYATHLRSLTKGRGSYSMEPLKFEITSSSS